MSRIIKCGFSRAAHLADGVGGGAIGFGRVFADERAGVFPGDERVGIADAGVDDERQPAAEIFRRFGGRRGDF